jgi:hypothetical protein
MSWSRNVRRWGPGLVLLVAVSRPLHGQQSSSAPTEAVPESSHHLPGDFAGAWAYNAQESVNAATGKPEQAPKSATRGGGRGPTPADPGGAGRGRGVGGGGYSGIDGMAGGGRGGGGSLVGPTPEMMRASRDLTRDLMEIPESLTISVAPGDVTIVDDLDRKRTYPTDGKKQHYLLGASGFDARVEWRDGQLHKDIDGGYGFKMSETYFLSEDGNRLFVILRVGDWKKGSPPNGANRVYDKVAR